MGLRMMRGVRSTLVAIACGGMISSPIIAQQPVAIPQTTNVVPVGKPLMLDVALHPNATLRGEVRSAEGQLLPDSDVVLWKDMEMVQRVRTNKRGQFQFTDVRSGAYRIATPETTVQCRVWSAELAPPAARQSLLIVANMYSARGQQPINEVFCFNPFLMGTIVAAAIAIPIAVHDSGDGQLPDGS